MAFFKTSIFLTIFGVVFVSIAIAPGTSEWVAGEKLSEYNITQEDLEFSPDLPSPVFDEIPLDSYQDSSNIAVNSTTVLGDPDFQTENYLSLADNSSSGWALYSVSGSTDYLNTKSTKFGFLQSSTIKLEQYESTNQSAITTTELSGSQSIEINPNANFVRVYFEPGEAEVYELEEQQGNEAGFFQTSGAYISSVSTALSSWVQIFTSLPPVVTKVGIVMTFLAIIIVALVILP